MTAEIADASNGTEDSLLERAVHKDGSVTIVELNFHGPQTHQWHRSRNQRHVDVRRNGDVFGRRHGYQRLDG